MLAGKISDIEGVNVLEDQLDINMVFFTLNSNEKMNLVESMKEKGIKINPPENGVYRFVTNKDITEEDMMKVSAAMKEILV
jgi:threonine aldolase